MDYEVLYAKMVEAAEQAIEAIEAADYGRAKRLLIAAEQGCEEAYLQKAECLPAKCPPSGIPEGGPAVWEIYFCSLLSTTSFRTAVKASSVMAPRSPSAR